MTERAILGRLGVRVRERRASRAMTLRELAERAGVSQRFLVSLEAGKANISVARLDDVARALNTSPAALLSETILPAAAPELDGDRWIALLGLRGAGKSAIGQRVAARLGLPFVELDSLVTERAGMSLESIFSLQGLDAYRRLEAEALRQLLARPDVGVVATGGSIVTHHETMGVLRNRCVTVWLQATPEDHWNRVVAQGDVRPMANRDDAMHELRSILRARRALYEQASHAVDTSSLGLERSVDAVVRIVRDASS